MSNQPVWKYVGTVGDENPVLHGGGIVMVDETGVYVAEVEVYVPDWTEDYRDPETGELKLEDGLGDPEFTVYVYRFPIPRYVQYEELLVNTRMLSPDRWEKCDMYEEWWVEKLDEIVKFTGFTKEELIEALCSDDPVQRASAFYNDILGYFGCEEFDSYPLIMPYSEADKRFDNMMAKGVPVC